MIRHLTFSHFSPSVNHATLHHVSNKEHDRFPPFTRFYRRNLVSIAITDQLQALNNGFPQFQNAMLSKEHNGKQLRLSILFTVPELPYQPSFILHYRILVFNQTSATDILNS